MNTKQLRQKIIDLAIRGKLVPQDPNDEPASVLLERVRAEKERLIKEGKIKRDKKDSTIIRGDDKSHYKQLPFDVPDGWVLCQLNDVVDYIQRGKSPKYSPIKQFPVLAQKCNQWKGITLEKALFIDPDTVDTYTSERFLKTGDVVINSTGVGTLGRIGIFDASILGDYSCIVADSHVTVVRSNVNINPKYLYFFFRSDYQQQKIEKSMKGSTNQKELYLDTIKNFELPLPPFAEQCRIVSAIESTFAFINEIEQNKGDLQTVVTATKSKILSLAIRGKLVPQNSDDEPASVLLERIRAEREALIKADKIKRNKNESTITRSRDNSYYRRIDGTEETLAKIPSTWKWVMLKDVGIYASGKTPQSNELLPVGRYPYFKVADMNTIGNELFLSITESYLSDGYDGPIFPANSIVFPKNGGAVLTNKKRILAQESLVDLNTGVYTPTTLLDFSYMFYFFTSIDFRTLFKGAVLPTIDRNVVELMAFPVPPLAEQHRIVMTIKAVFEQMDRIIATLT